MIGYNNILIPIICQCLHFPQYSHMAAPISKKWCWDYIKNFPFIFFLLIFHNFYLSQCLYFIMLIFHNYDFTLLYLLYFYITNRLNIFFKPIISKLKAFFYRYFRLPVQCFFGQLIGELASSLLSFFCRAVNFFNIVFS